MRERAFIGWDYYDIKVIRKDQIPVFLTLLNNALAHLY